jgi:L-amino acid N-acyltransferase YncA
LARSGAAVYPDRGLFVFNETLVTDLTIRPFAWNDVPAITAIYRHYVETSVVTFDTDAPAESAMAEKFGHLADLGHPLIVGEQGGKVVGYAYASLFRPRYAYRFTCEDSVYLHPDAVGKGHGSALLGDLLVRSKAFGFKQMIAVITAGTQSSIRLHEKHGFKLLGTYPELGYKFDRWLDIVHMQRAL